MENNQVLEEWFAKVWVNEDAAVIHQMYVPDSDNKKKARGLGEEALGPKEFEQFHAALLNLVNVEAITVDQSWNDGDWLIARCTMTASARSDSSRKVGMQGCVIGRITDDKIREAHNYFDFMTLFERLGLLPEGCFAKCLGGEAV